jgi:hypothetical protein
MDSLWRNARNADQPICSTTKRPARVALLRSLLGGTARARRVGRFSWRFPKKAKPFPTGGSARVPDGIRVDAACGFDGRSLAELWVTSNCPRSRLGFSPLLSTVAFHQTSGSLLLVTVRFREGVFGLDAVGTVSLTASGFRTTRPFRSSKLSPNTVPAFAVRAKGEQSHVTYRSFMLTRQSCLLELLHG